MRRPRRSRLVSSAAFVLALVTLGALWNLVFPSGGSARAATGNPDPNNFTADQVSEGAKLFAEGCASCHGSAGQGGTQAQAPPLIGVGAAAADFQLTTGRMPLKAPAAQAPVKPVQYSPEQILALDAYVASLGAGPQIPSVDGASGDIAVGGQLFRANCANCHNFAGQGNVLSNGKYAPAVTPATDLQVAEAVRTGPESMPKFAPTQLSQNDVNSIVRYIEFLRAPKDPGGHGLGHLGPVPEGLVCFLVGIAGLAIICLWIGERAKA
ncbi:MAG TPA: c-type cytochrome [Mycobacteriales bacterium]|nr:c-type cytochrome [Mycobacteriales bacterium]